MNYKAVQQHFQRFRDNLALRSVFLLFLLFAGMGCIARRKDWVRDAHPGQERFAPIMKDSRLLAEQRRRKILDLIEQKGQVTVRELVERFEVSAVTARGDLDALCSGGMAVRSHGGAVRKLDGSPNSKDALRFADVARLAEVSVDAVSRIAIGR